MKRREPIIELERAPDGVYVPGNASAPKSKRRTQRGVRHGRKNPQESEEAAGRLDIFLSRALKQTITATQNPVWMGLYARFQPAIDHVIRKHLGPVNTKPVRRLRRAS